MRSRKEIYLDSIEHYEELSEQKPDKRAQKWFHRPAGAQTINKEPGQQAKKLIKTTVDNQLRKWGVDIKGSVADGQEKTTEKYLG